MTFRFQSIRPAKIVVFLQNLLVFQKEIPTFARSLSVQLTEILILMYLTPEKKQEIFGQYGKSNTDTGSPESQIALFSYRINHLTDHLKSNKKDYSTARALRMLVGKRRRLLDYLKDKDIEKYRALIKELNLRR
jgi:small subunit ribosomal protein S15